MSWGLTISLLWFVGWLIACFAYLRLSMLDAKNAERRLSLSTAFSRWILLLIFWPLFLIGWAYFKRKGDL